MSSPSENQPPRLVPGPDPVADAYDRLAATYDDTYSDEVSAAEDRRVLSLLRPEIKRARNVLDVGCGTGWVLDHCIDLFTATGRRYEGFDLSQGMIDRLREKHPRFDVWTGDLNDHAAYGQGRGSQRPDLVVSTFASPSYVESKPEWLRYIGSEVLAPGGRVFLMPHARGNDQRTPYLEHEEAYIGDKPWAERTTHRALAQAGFTDVQIVGLRHPTMGPGEHRKRMAHDLWLKVEARLFRPDALCFLIITATKEG